MPSHFFRGVSSASSPAAGENPAPKLGQHSVEILREAGYADAEIDAMIEQGVTLDGRLAK